MNAMTDTKDIWQLLEEAPKAVEATADLYHWSTNFGAGKGPFSLFLDLIGWSDDELGEPVYNMKDAALGYVELDKLGDALKEYADTPTIVREFVDQLIAAEMGDED